MTIKFRASVDFKNREQVEKLLTTAAARRTLRSAAVLGQAMEAEVRRTIRSYYNTDRPPERRKTGSPRLINSFEADVKSFQDEFPITVTMRPKRNVRSNADAMAKIGALLYGSEPHEIPNAFGKGGTITHPGTAGRNFLVDACLSVLQRSNRVPRMRFPGAIRRRR